VKSDYDRKSARLIPVSREERTQILSNTIR
jgi:hypothetical protein